MAIEIIRGLTSIITDASATVTSRRSFLRGATAAGFFLAAPPVARAASLMNIRGEPLIAQPEFIPCDGRVLTEREEPDLFAALQAQDRISQIWPGDTIQDGMHLGRQYGGDREGRSFAVPDFNFGGFDFIGARAPVSYEIDRRGELYVSVKPVESMRDEVYCDLALSFGSDYAHALVKGERVKL